MPPERRLLRLIELLVLFGVFPWWWAGAPMREWGWGIWPPIAVGGLGCLLYLLLDRGFEKRRLWNLRGARRGMRWMLIRFLIGAVLLTTATYLFEPELFLRLPRERTGLWIAIMLLYPIFSVYPQEIIFRAFFVRRYGDLLRGLGGTAALVAAGAAAFGWGHVMFGADAWMTAIAVGLSAIGGVLFMTTYLRTESTLAATVEHALYGDLLFTVGLGWYFYSGNING